jgi:HD-GYP domain-containing protein (c-di-GMP phosphodiesterase class II)
MKRDISVNLGNLVLSLSDAMDLANSLLAQHQQRTAFIFWEMGKVANLSDGRLEKGFIAALLHDIGALTVEDKISLVRSETRDIEGHCIQGEFLLKKVSWLRDAGQIIRFHHKEWKDWEEPIDTPLVLESQLIFLADCVERMIDRSKYILHQHEDIISKIKANSGSSFHPDAVDLFMKASDREEFWLDLVSQRLYSLLLHEGPFRKTEIDLSEISTIAGLFRDIIDFRSRFTSTHSSGVAAAASILSKLFGYTEMETRLIEVAGDLHDLGKLAIPNSILNKPGKLTKEEMAVMKSHTYFTYSVISSIGGLNQIAEWGAYHHEKLDGSGYPFHCKAGELTTGSRIMAVADIYTALAEDRPYRKGMSEKEIVRIIKDFSDRKLLDSGIVNLLLKNHDEISFHVSAKQAVVRESYEEQYRAMSKKRDGIITPSL